MKRFRTLSGRPKARIAIRFLPIIIMILLQSASSSGLAMADSGSVALWLHNREQPSKDGIQALRAKGPSALKRLLKEFFTLRSGLAQKERRGAELWFDQWIDKVCAQKFCRASQLFWYTDFASALAEARKENKPILRLRLLGRLDEELSCANSRFFRIFLYPHPSIAPLLREKFILFWDSERPVPKVTIDFGTGHEITTTLTGNSAHFVYDSQGRLIDVIPGFSHPQMIAAELRADELLSRQISNLSEPEFLSALYNHHRAALSALDAEWALLLPGSEKNPSRADLEKEERPRAKPDASTASTRAITKNLIQAPLLKATGFADTDPINRLNRDELWRKLATKYQKDDPISPPSRLLIEQELIPPTDTVQPNYNAIYANLASAIALDTVRNRFLLHADIHRWFSSSDVPLNFESLNAKVYRELFLSPPDDPWMGLVKTESFNGLRANGTRFAPPQKEVE